MSESFDLSGFEVANKVRVGVKEKAAGKATQAYDLKYRDGSFSFSQAQWTKLGLDDKSVKILVNPATKQVALKVVDNDEGTIFKRTPKTGVKKFRKAKAPSIENTLAEAGLLTKTKHVKGVEGTNQLFSLVDKGNDLYLITAVSETPKNEVPATPVASSFPTAEPSTVASDPVETTQAPVITDQVPSSDELIVDGSQFGGTTDVSTEAAAPAEDEDFDEKF